MSPSVVSAFAPPAANSGVPVTKVLMLDAAPPRSWATGSACVEKFERLLSVGTSSRRNCGSSVKFSSSAALREAVALAVFADELMKPATLRRSRANGASALSPSTASCASVLFCEARIASTLSNWRSAGLDLRSAACSSAPLPARPVPNSLRKIVKRWRNGSRMMLLIRSRSTERAVFVEGSRYSPDPGPSWIWDSSGAFGLPAICGCVGSHST